MNLLNNISRYCKTENDNTEEITFKTENIKNEVARLGQSM